MSEADKITYTGGYIEYDLIYILFVDIHFSINCNSSVKIIELTR